MRNELRKIETVVGRAIGLALGTVLLDVKKWSDAEALLQLYRCMLGLDERIHRKLSQLETSEHSRGQRNNDEMTRCRDILKSL